MSSDSEKLDLFPLNVVLFPGSLIELHIFEERYRTMIRQCLDEHREFGVVLHENNQLHSIGCSALVREVSHSYPDGSYDIIAEGRSIFRLKDISQADAGYFQGDTESVDEEPAAVPQSVLSRVIALFNAMLDIVYPAGHAAAVFNSPSDRIAFQIAEKAGLELPERQRILETLSETRRLEMLADHLETTIPRLKEEKEIRRVVANDGYLPRLKPN
jgi:uncharacterized protein